MTLFYSLFLVLFLVLAIFIYFDILPYVRRKISSLKFLSICMNDYEYKNLVNKCSLHFIKSDKTYMIHSDDQSFIHLLSVSLNIFKPKRLKAWYYHFPKAFLFYGLAIFNQDNKELSKKIEYLYIKKFINKYNKLFTIDGIERSFIAVVALYYYKSNKNKIYLDIINDTYSFILNSLDNNNIVHYFNKGENKENIYVDGLGMYIPFLIMYYETFKDCNALELAKYNFDYYSKVGTYKSLPFHNIKNNIPLGPNNWGRGIGWYIIGILFLIDVDEKYIQEAKRLLEILFDCQSSKYEWSQFIGTSNKYDSSATIPILLLIKKVYPDLYDKEKSEILNIIKKRTLYSGAIYYTSGDTRGINRYCDLFGVSEFTQGLLLLLLSDKQN